MPPLTACTLVFHDCHRAGCTVCKKKNRVVFPAFFFCCSAQEFCFATFPPLDSKHRRISQDDFLVETQQSAIWFFFKHTSGFHSRAALHSSSTRSYSAFPHKAMSWKPSCKFVPQALVEDATCSTRFSNPAYIVRLTPKRAKVTLMCLRVFLSLYTRVDMPSWLPCFPAQEQI